MKKKIILSLSIVMVILIVIIIVCINKYTTIDTIGEIAYNYNENDYYVYIKENDKYIKYIVLTNKYNNSKNTLVMRDRIIGNSNFTMGDNGSIYEEKVYNGTIEMETDYKYEETAVDIFLENEFLDYFDDEFLNLLNVTEINVPDVDNYILSRKFFLLSLKEIGFDDPGDETNYDLIKYFNNNSRIAKNDGNVVLCWWTRSVNQALGSRISIGVDGNENAVSSTDAKYGIRPAFTIPNDTKIKKVHINDEIGNGYIIDYK